MIFRVGFFVNIIGLVTFSFIGLTAEMEKSDAFKINQTFGLSEANENIEIPSKYIILNPSDIQLQGSIAFSSGCLLQGDY